MTQHPNWLSIDEASYVELEDGRHIFSLDWPWHDDVIFKEQPYKTCFIDEHGTAWSFFSLIEPLYEYLSERDEDPTTFAVGNMDHPDTIKRMVEIVYNFCAHDEHGSSPATILDEELRDGCLFGFDYEYVEKEKDNG